MFTALAEAEASVHGLPSDRVHFHEVGAIDSVVDVVGVCAALHHLDPDQISCESPPVGHGSVQTAHGCLPVPVPAVLELSRRHRIPLRRGTDFPGGELTTPTGLALMAVLSDRFEAPEQVTPLAIGCGLGHRDLDRPNQLRITQLAPLQSGFGDDLRPRWQSLVVQEAWIDDASAEDVAVLVDQEGSLVRDVASQPIQMKKGGLVRPSVLSLRPSRRGVTPDLVHGGSHDRSRERVQDVGCCRVALDICRRNGVICGQTGAPSGWIADDQA